MILRASVSFAGLVLLVACSAEEGSGPKQGSGGSAGVATGGNAGTSGDAGMSTGGSAGSATGGGAGTDAGSGGASGSGGTPSTCGALLFEEKFLDDKLSSRGWTGVNPATQSVVSDAQLGANALQLNLKKGAQSPGQDAKKFSPAEELTVQYRLRMGPTWNWLARHHVIVLHSDRDLDNYDASNAYGTTYLEWEWDKPGVFWGKFQDNLAVNCGQGYKDLTSITEERSVGGFQSWQVPAGQVASYWGNPCTNGLSTYTGQSILEMKVNGADHPMTGDEWWELTAYLKMNSIQGGKAQRDGIFHMEWQGPKDSKPVVVMNHENVIWRAGGQNKALKWAKLIIAPWLHDGATTDMWLRIADISARVGRCTGG